MTEFQDHKQRKLNHVLFVTFCVFFLLFNWEVLLAFTAINESLVARVEFIRKLNLGILNILWPLLATVLYIAINSKIQSWIEIFGITKAIATQQRKSIESESLVGKYSEIGLAGKNVIDETLIYGTVQENYLKKNTLSIEEMMLAREQLCLKYQDSFKKIQELMIVLAMQNKNKIAAMHQRLKDEKRI